MGKAKLLMILLMSVLLAGCASNGGNAYSEERVDEFLTETLEQLQAIITTDDGTVYRNDSQVFVILKGDKSFRSASSEIRSEGLPVLKQFADHLVANPYSNIFICGHTDSTGAAEYNRQLASQRALSVTEFFVSRGIEKERINSYGVGEWSPIASNDWAYGRQENRRIEIRITPAFESNEG